METETSYSMLFSFVSIFVLMFQLSMCSTSFTVSNNCPQTIWPGTLAGAGTPQLPTTGFRLDSGQTVQIPAPPGWSGRIWARTGCEFDSDGAGICQTGDCGGRMECGGTGSLPPTTLFEITLGKGTDEDYYDVSLVDGYNLPVVAIPQVQHGRCNATGCITDLNRGNNLPTIRGGARQPLSQLAFTKVLLNRSFISPQHTLSGCPRELQVECGDGVVACKSACEAFGLDQYCCSGEFANPSTCKPSLYSSIFKTACPRAYSYAFDDGTSTFTCKAYDYTIVFCPPASGMKRSDDTSVGQPIVDGRDRSRDQQLEMASSSSKRSFHKLLLLLLGLLKMIMIN